MDYPTSATKTVNHLGVAKWFIFKEVNYKIAPQSHNNYVWEKNIKIINSDKLKIEEQ
jgi:hypothetical protein